MQQSNRRWRLDWGVVEEETQPGKYFWGGRFPILWGGKLRDKKNNEKNTPWPWQGRHLMEIHNNQPKVGGSDG
jgi:hypothetical protein